MTTQAELGCKRVAGEEKVGGHVGMLVHLGVCYGNEKKIPCSLGSCPDVFLVEDVATVTAKNDEGDHVVKQVVGVVETKRGAVGGAPADESFTKRGLLQHTQPRISGVPLQLW